MRNSEKLAGRVKLGWIALVLLVIISCKYVSDNWFQLMLIQGNSMAPSYHSMQLVVLDKRECAYGPGDVVAFRCESLGSVLVKRIAAGPGQVAVIQDGKLLVDGQETPAYGETVFSYAGILSKAVVLSAGEYIVIGDNVEESRDSRFEQVGVVGAESILGKVL